jgi:hypothetical protein
MVRDGCFNEKKNEDQNSPETVLFTLPLARAKGKGQHNTSQIGFPIKDSRNDVFCDARLPHQHSLV